jgi:hypothetical protein
LVGQNTNLSREMPVAEPEMPPQGLEMPPQGMMQ